MAADTEQASAAIVPLSSTASVFDAAKIVSEALSTLSMPDREKALRLAAVSLDIPLSGGTHDLSNLYKYGPDSGRTITAFAVESQGTRTKDILTFVREKKPTSDQQYAAIVAYYYRFEAPSEQRQDFITSDMLVESTRLSQYRRLPNPNSTLHNAVKQGYLDKAGHGGFKLSTVGENLVAMTLPSSTVLNNSSRPRKPKARAHKSIKRGKTAAKGK